MSRPANFLAIDLGAESGRGLLVSLRDGRVDWREVHRFPNGGRRIGDRLVWDAIAIYGEILHAMTRARETLGGSARLDAMAVDSWGVDFALLDRACDPVAPCFHYRDARTEGIIEKACQVVPRAEIFRRTGIQFLRFNTILQLYAMKLEGSPALGIADRLLMIPDLMNYWLTGVKTQERTNATTTQALDPATGDWADDLISALGLPRRIFGPLGEPGSVLGALEGRVAAETGLGATPVALAASHDTGSAVAAVPAGPEPGWAYISCGTWALIGAETRGAIINDDALAFNFTNEGGVFGTNRLLSNVMGLWLLQESRRSWARAGRELSYEQIAREAAAAPPLRALIDPDDPAFFNPDDMVAEIAGFCARSGQPPPEGVGPTARCVIDSLALKYRMKIEQIERLIGRAVEVIHVVGGGSRNELLCQATADACVRRVTAGPAEATALGNGLMQAVAVGVLKTHEELRAVVRASTERVEYSPAGNAAAWEEAWVRFKSLPRPDAD